MTSYSAASARASAAPNSQLPISHSDVINSGREVLLAEARAVDELADRLDDNFYRAVELLYGLHGNLLVTGIGKAGLIGQKLAATFASTGTRAHFLHPAEAFHGDLGRLRQGDIVLMLSQSGETGEVVQLLPSLRKMGVPLVAITASTDSTVGQVADVTLALGKIEEACSLGLAPSTSTAAMLALGDALALVVSQLKGFAAEDFAKFHPGGTLGLKLSHVEDHMRPLEECRLASESRTIRQVLVDCTKPGRRSGAIMLLDADGRLTGLFTDSDLARLIEARNDTALDMPVRDCMVTAPATILSGSKTSKAIELLSDRKFSELPVVDAEGRPTGLIDVTDLVGLLPKPEPSELPVLGNLRTQLRVFSGEQLPETD